MLGLEILQIAHIDLGEIVIICSSGKIIKHDEHRNYAARSHDLTSNSPFVISHFAVASAKVLVFSVVCSVYAFSVASVGSCFVHAILALIVGSEGVWPAGAAENLIN